MRKVRNIYKREISTGPRSVTRGETVITNGVSGGTWSPSLVRTPGSGVIEVTSVAPTSTRHGAGNVTRIETPDAGWDAFATLELTTPIDFRHLRLRVLVWMDDFEVTGSNDVSTYPFLVRASSDAAANTFNNFVDGVANMRPGWNNRVFALDRRTGINNNEFVGFATTGSPDLSSIKRFRFGTGGPGGVSPRIEIRHVAMGGMTKPVIIINEDDCWANFFSRGLQYMQDRGLKCTFYCIPSKIGTGTGENAYATWTQMAEAQAFGHAVCDHTLNHSAQPFLVGASVAAIQAEIEGGRDELIARGFTIRNEHLFFADPYNESSRENTLPNYRTAVQNAGMLFHRSVVESIQGPGCADPHNETCIWLDGTDANNNPDLVIARIWEAVKAGGVIRLLFHKLADTVGGDTNVYLTAGFKKIMDFIAALCDADLAENMTDPEYYDTFINVPLVA